MGTEDEKLIDLQSYPVLTSEVAATAPGRATTASPLGRTVEQAIREVLGWRPKASDPKGFRAALNQSFAGKERQGRMEYSWTQHTYAVQADMGALTGAQASIYTRAKAALDQALPLLEGLTPLGSCSDDQDVEAIRAVVRSELLGLVDELGMVGGPRVARVDQLLESLVEGVEWKPFDPGFGGHLRTLRDTFHLDTNYVNTIDEEHDLTNYLVLANYVCTLKQGWDADRPCFLGDTGTAYLGTQLVRLSRQLAAIAEQVQETNFVMDSVFLGQSERETTQLTLDGEILTIAELLDWIETAAAQHLRDLIRDGGKIGVAACVPILKKLHDLVSAAWNQAGPTPGAPNRGFHTPRVENALGALRRQIEQAIELAHPVGSPSDTRFLLSVEPSEVRCSASRNRHEIVLRGVGLPSEAARVKAIVLTRGQVTVDLTTMKVAAAQISGLRDFKQTDHGLWDVVATIDDVEYRLAGGLRVVWEEDSGAAPAPAAPSGVALDQLAKVAEPLVQRLESVGQRIEAQLMAAAKPKRSDAARQKRETATKRARPRAAKKKQEAAARLARSRAAKKKLAEEAAAKI